MEIVKTFDINNKKYGLKKLNNKESYDLDIHYKAEYAKALREGCATIAEIDSMIKSRNLEDESHIKEKDALVDELLELEQKLNNEELSKDEKFNAASELMLVRRKLLALNTRLQPMYEVTAEQAAQDARNRLMFIRCFINLDTNKPYFATQEEFNSAPDSEEIGNAFKEFLFYIYNLDPNFEKDLPENKWLVEHEYLDENLQLIDKQSTEQPKIVKKKTAKKKTVKKQPKKTNA